MMKKVLALILVLGMASLANATVIDVVTVGLGSMGHAGTSMDPLEPSETIGIKIVLNSNPYAGFPSFDGYLLSMMDVDLHLSGPGSLDVGTKDKSGNPVWKYNAGFSAFGVVDPKGAINPPYNELANGLDQIAGVCSPPIGPPGTGSTGPIDLVWDLIIHCEGGLPVTVDLTLDGLSQYAPYSAIDGTSPFPNPPGWVDLVEGDLGDLVIHQIPEPMTIALLGLGGLFLRRRR
jgi:hypothetical protein